MQRGFALYFSKNQVWKDIVSFQCFEAVNIQKEPSTSGFSLDPSPSSTQTCAHMLYIFIFLKPFPKSEGALSVKIFMFINPPRPISRLVHLYKTHLPWSCFPSFPLPLATLILENKLLRMDCPFLPFSPFAFPWASPGRATRWSRFPIRWQILWWPVTESPEPKAVSCHFYHTC